MARGAGSPGTAQAGAWSLQQGSWPVPVRGPLPTAPGDPRPPAGAGKVAGPGLTSTGLREASLLTGAFCFGYPKPDSQAEPLLLGRGRRRPSGPPGLGQEGAATHRSPPPGPAGGSLPRPLGLFLPRSQGRSRTPLGDLLFTLPHLTYTQTHTNPAQALKDTKEVEVLVFSMGGKTCRSSPTG